MVDRNGVVIAGNQTLQVLAANGIEDVIEIETEGNEWVVVKRTDTDLAGSDPNNTARRMAFRDNRSQELSLTWNPEQLQADKEAGVEIVDKLWHPVELDDIFNSVPFIDKEAKPNPRNLPIDVIYTQTFTLSCCLAVQAGFKYGIQSAKQICPMCKAMTGHELVFVDNNYFDYNHAIHCKYVAEHRPKYCTVMDVMTPDQCRKDNIKYHSFEQILDWAEGLCEYAENVIIIPKYDCLDDIPDKYILGYSVPTSHGGTPLSPEMFKGRRVHLLGGSWKAQLAHMAVLGDDVVSLDNNYIGMIAQVGGCVLSDGTRKDLPSYGIDTRVNPQYISLAISLGNIGAKINELYPKAVEVPAITKT